MCRACPTLDPQEVFVVPEVDGRRTRRDVDWGPYIVWFDAYVQQRHRDRVGGKNASLGALMGAGLPVPPGFAITTDAYATLREHHDLVDLVHAILDDLDTEHARALEEASRTIRDRIEGVPLPPEVEVAVRHAYDALCQLCDHEDVPVAVRSSATAEDLPDASFAGQQDTFLWVTGAEGLLEHVKRCWSSLYTARAMSYRHERGYDHELISMSVGVQKMVDPVAAGVAFTLNPSDGDRSQIAIDASWGFGEAVVSGEVTPDNFLVDKVILEVVSRTVSPKTVEYRLNGQRVVCVDLDPEDERSTACCLTDDQIKAVARLAKKAEKHYGRPQDVEWAIDRHLPEGDNVVLLQSRPETVWSNKPRKKVSAGAKTGVAGVVSSLLAPVHSKPRSTTVEEPS